MACPPLAEREAGDASVTRHTLLVGVIAPAVTNRQLSLSDICTRPKYIRNTRVAFLLAQMGRVEKALSPRRRVARRKERVCRRR